MIYFSSPNYTFNILEETPAGTFVGNVSILPDTPALDNLVFGIVGGNGSELFSIDRVKGEIAKLSRRIDRESNDMFYLDIYALLPEQEPPLVAHAAVILNVDDLNDNYPRFSMSIYPTVVISAEKLDVSIPLMSVSATDDDIGTNADVEYNILSVTFNQIEDVDSTSLFALNVSTGELFPVSSQIMHGNYSLYISGNDKGQPRLTGYTIVTITVQQEPSTTSSALIGGLVFLAALLMIILIVIVITAGVWKKKRQNNTQ